MTKAIEYKLGWWLIRFRMLWPEDEEPKWHVDLILAHRVINPVLQEFRNDISLWRFHRRAARDDEGHQFSFMFYASPESALEINKKIQGNALLKELIKAGIISEIIYDEDTNSILRPNVKDTSDGRWSLPIQNSWPYFIEGVCLMWLTLIDNLAEESGKKIQRQINKETASVL